MRTCGEGHEVVRLAELSRVTDHVDGALASCAASLLVHLQVVARLVAIHRDRRENLPTQLANVPDQLSSAKEQCSLL